METALAKRTVIEEARRSEEGHGGSMSETKAQAMRIEQTVSGEIGRLSKQKKRRVKQAAGSLWSRPW